MGRLLEPRTVGEGRHVDDSDAGPFDEKYEAAEYVKGISRPYAYARTSTILFISELSGVRRSRGSYFRFNALADFDQSYPAEAQQHNCLCAIFSSYLGGRFPTYLVSYIFAFLVSFCGLDLHLWDWDTCLEPCAL